MTGEGNDTDCVDAAGTKSVRRARGVHKAHATQHPPRHRDFDLFVPAARAKAPMPPAATTSSEAAPILLPFG
jgi:hypothetical protein